MNYGHRRLLLYWCLIGIILVISSACGNSFSFQVKVIDANGYPIKRARVELSVGGNITALSSITDNSGHAVINVDSSRADKLGQITVTADNYKPYTQYLALKKDELPTEVMLESITSNSQSQALIKEDDNEVIATSQPTSTHTPVSTFTEEPTATPVFTASPSPAITMAALTPTPVPSTPTAVAPTPTRAALTPTIIMSSPTPQIVQVQAKNKPVKVYGGPDMTKNPAVGTLGSNAIAEVTGKSEDAEWYKVYTPQGKEGWICSHEVDLINGSLDKVPVEWGATFSCIEGVTPQPLPSCLTAVVERQQSTLPVDTVVIHWQNIPTDAAYYNISVYTITDTGGKAYVKELDRADFGTANYTIGDWEFDVNHIAPGTPFIFEVTVYDAVNNVICTFSGNFTT